MDINDVAMSMSQMQLQTQIDCALMENVKELAEVQGEALSEMIQSVPAPSPAGIGQNIDISL